MVKKEEKDYSKWKEKVLFTFSTQKFLKKDKIRFYYGLKGRDGKSGIVKATKAEHLGSAVILVDIKHEKEWEDFFNLWKIPFQKKRVLVE
jgi:hypothetical protein